MHSDCEGSHNDLLRDELPPVSTYVWTPGKMIQDSANDPPLPGDLTILWRPITPLRRTWPRSAEKGELFEFGLSGYPHARDYFPSLLEPEKPSGRFLERMLNLGFHAPDS